VDQISGTTPTDAPAAPAQAPPAAAPAPATPPAPAGSNGSAPSGFQPRGRARRRARFLRKARELAYRDLGGLVFNLHRFGQRNDALVLAKLNTLGQIDGELRAIEAALGERRPITVLREAGITACARCAAIHSSEDSFCPNCGLSMGRHADLPIGAAAPPTPSPAGALVGATQAPATPPTSAAPPAPTAPPTSVSPPAPATPPASATQPAAPTRTRPRAAPPMHAAATTQAPATPPPAPAGGRAPAPPSAPNATEEAAGEDGPTEILRPPMSES
jgi:hypothetical protein